MLNILKSDQESEDSSKRKRSNSQRKYQKAPDIITQAKPNSFVQPINPHKSAFTPSNRSKKLFSDKLLLPPKSQEFSHKKTLILDLDETLVHSSFTPFEKNDIILEVDFEGVIYKIYVLVRPFAKEFLNNVSKYFEVVIFTASIPKYASPLLNILDNEKTIKHRLYREECTFINGLYIKDLKRLNRPMKDLIMVDNSPLAYAFNSENGLPIKTWYDDRNDTELKKILPLLIFLSNVKDVRRYIELFVDENEINYDDANELIKRYENNNSIEEEENKKNMNVINNDINNNKKNNDKDEQKNKENDNLVSNQENSLFNEYKNITSNIKKSIKFSFNNLINLKNDNKINISNPILLNKSDNEKNDLHLMPIEKIKPKNLSINKNIEENNDKKRELNIGILLRKQSSKKKNLFRLNQKSIEPLLNIKTNKNNENNKNSQTNSFYNNHNNLQNLVLPFSNTTKNYLFPKNFISSNFITNNKVNNLAQIHMTKNGLIDNKTKIKYSNLLEKIDKKNFTFRNEDNIKISFSSSNNNNDLKQMAKDKNNNKYKFLQISKSNSINNIIKFNNLSNNVNISKKMAKTPNKHLINLLRNDNRGNFGFSKRVEKTNMLYNLIRGIGSPKSKRIKNISYSANPNSIRKHSKNN
jgi:RNA polymerase II subunit A small phosphatase-like protein